MPPTAPTAVVADYTLSTPTAPAAVVAAASNSGPTAPAAVVAAGSYSGPTAPAAVVAAASNSGPTAPAAVVAAASNSAPSSPVQVVENFYVFNPDAPDILGYAPAVRSIKIGARFSPALSNDGKLLTTGTTLNSRPVYSTDGTLGTGAAPAAGKVGPWVVVWYNGTVWRTDVYLDGTLKANWQGPTNAYANPSLVPGWSLNLNPSPNFPTDDWKGVPYNLYTINLITGGCQIVPRLTPSWVDTVITYFAPDQGRGSYADSATWNGESYDIANILLRWVGSSPGEGSDPPTDAYWHFGAPGSGPSWKFLEDRTAPTGFVSYGVPQQNDTFGNPTLTAVIAAPAAVIGAYSISTPSAPTGIV